MPTPVVRRPGSTAWWSNRRPSSDPKFGSLRRVRPWLTRNLVVRTARQAAVVSASLSLEYPRVASLAVLLDELENQSIYILREAFNKFEKLAMLWSIGKDSTVLLWLARKAFFGHVPFPLVHVDTTYKIPR